MPVSSRGLEDRTRIVRCSVAFYVGLAQKEIGHSEYWSGIPDQNTWVCGDCRTVRREHVQLWCAVASDSEEHAEARGHNRTGEPELSVGICHLWTSERWADVVTFGPIRRMSKN
jgi:hypothetical protein